VGLSVIGGVVAAGVQGYDSWPFAVMPRFDRRFPGKRHNYTFRLERNDGTVLDGYDSAYFRSLSDSKYLRQMRRIRRGKKRRKRKKLLALARSIRAAGDRIGPGDELKILQLTRSLSDDDPFAPAPRQRVRAKIVLPESF
jgi:hypothetical protein